MAICTFEELGLHEVNNCIYPKGGISAIAVLKTGHGITDWTDDVEWDAAITAGTVRIIANTKSDLPAASAIEGENPLACGSETIVDSFDYTINLKDFNVSTIDKSLPVPVANNANDAFWNDANRLTVEEKKVNHWHSDAVRHMAEDLCVYQLLEEDEKEKRL